MTHLKLFRVMKHCNALCAFLYFNTCMSFDRWINQITSAEIQGRPGTRGTLLQEFWSDQWYMVNIWKNHDQRQPRPCISDQNIRWPGEVQRAGKQRTQEGGWWTRGYCWWTATFELLTNQEFELWPDISNQCKTTVSNSLSSASHHPEFRWTLIG